MRADHEASLFENAKQKISRYHLHLGVSEYSYMGYIGMCRGIG